MTYKKKHDKLIMIGKGLGYADAPRSNHKYDIWVINDLIYSRQDIDMVWEMHKFSNHSIDQMAHIRLAEELGIPVMMPEKQPNFKYVIEFPLAKICKKFKSDYFMAVMPYMIAYAIDLGYKEIDMYGCNMGGIGEIYKNAKSCVEYWIGRAEGSGIKVNLHGKHNKCLKTFDRRLYGYDDKFQWIPEDITDKSLYLTFGCTLSNKASKKLYSLLNSQNNSVYANNFKLIPYTDLSDNNYRNRQAVEDAINFNVRNISMTQDNQHKYVGDVGFFYLPYYNNLLVVHHTFKMIYITDDYDNIKKDWLELSKEYNFWTDHNSKYWNGDKPHPKFDNLFPKYDLPKRQALEAYHKFYDDKAQEFKKLFPNHIIIADKSILDTEEGQRQILEFIGYKQEEMIIREADEKDKSHISGKRVRFLGV